MKVRLDDNSTHRFWVSSESDSGVEYIVDICEIEIGVNPSTGVMRYNGACGLTEGRIHGCADFKYRCEPRLKDRTNFGKVYRCKHILAAEAHALEIIKPLLKKADPNVHEEFQT